MCWCANWETQAQDHTWGLGYEANQVEGGWGLVRGAVEEEFIKAFFLQIIIQ